MASACLLAGVLGGTSPALAQGPTLEDGHNIPTNAVAGNVTFLDNVSGVSGYSALNFIHYDKYGTDFMFANGTGGLAVWSLQDPAHPALVSKLTAAELRVEGDTRDRFWEGENMTVDQKRKLVFLSRDPRGFGGQLTTGQSGVYIIDVKDPWNPKMVIFHPIPAGHTSTCINDCQYLWTVGPYATGTPGNDPAWMPQPAYSQPWGGVPVWVTNIQDIEHPYTYADPVDTDRFDGKTGYAHGVDVDRNGVAWVAGAGGDRGYWTSGNHWDPVAKENRIATAFDPVPYAGGVTPPVDPERNDFFAYFDHNVQHSTAKLGDYDKGELLFVTNEDIQDCPTAGELKIVSLKGSYNGEGWRSTEESPFRLKMVSHWTVWGQEGADDNPESSCSAHWFTMNGNIIVQAWYGQGTRFIDVSDPEHPKQVGYFRVPGGTEGVTGGSASATYWHNGLVYVADYRRGVDVLRFDGEVTGDQEGICWSGCDKATVSVPETPAGEVGGTVPATLSMSLGQPASFGAFAPGVENDYSAATTANVISTAGDATLSVADPSSTETGHLVNGTFSLASPLQARARNAANQDTAFADVGSSASPLSLLTYSGPISNDAVSLEFQQHVGANDPLRTGSYSKSLTFTLSTTNP
ncbi:MAG TPA: hypothetical protein VFG79_12145 [Solirubrobacter sp.]|nr:hypothetical protein [Solirubrobacter sp.]